MRFLNALLPILLAVSSTVAAWNRIDKDNAALLIVDHQIGLAQLVRDYSVNDFRNAMLAHAELGLLFDLPVVLTTSADTGPNGPMLQEILDMYPNVTVVQRQGEVNAWDNEEFRKAVRETGRGQLVVGGIVTEVCTAFLALSLIDEGYEVFSNSEASGTFDTRIALDATRRMEKAGVTTLGLFAIVCDLMRDWRSTPGLKEVLPYLQKYQFAYGLIARAHAGALENGTLAE